MLTPQLTPTQVDNHERPRTSGLADSGFSQYLRIPADAETRRGENPHFKIEDVR